MSNKTKVQTFFITQKIENFIIEKNLITALPFNRQLSFGYIKKQTGINFSKINNHIRSELFNVQKSRIEITDNRQLLSEKTTEYCKYLIKKYIFPSQYTQDQYAFHARYLVDTKYYTSEENSFIGFMLKNFLSVVNMDFCPKETNIKDLLNFNFVNSNGFYHISKEVYNAILQKKLRVGDSILPYINKTMKNKKRINTKLKMSSEYDFYFNENAVLKCDLETNTSNLIKNFLNSVIYEINDNFTRIVLLAKLQCRYPILLKDKIFCEFD